MGLKSVLKSAIPKISEYPVGRMLLGAVASVYGRALVPGFRVYWEEGVWIHRYAGFPSEHYGVHEKIMLPKRLPEGNRDIDLWLGELIHQPPESMRTLLGDICQYVPKPGDTVVDIGAGKGTATAVMAHFVGPQGKVIAVEAHPRQLQCLRKLCQLNKLEQVMIQECAVSDRPGELIIQDTETPDANSVLNQGDGFKVRAKTVDDILSELAVENVDLLTMNIEGAEALAIQGMTHSISRIRHLVIACHDFRADTDHDQVMKTRDTVTEFLNQHGFKITSYGSDQYGEAFGDWIAASNVEENRPLADPA